MRRSLFAALFAAFMLSVMAPAQATPIGAIVGPSQAAPGADKVGLCSSVVTFPVPCSTYIGDSYFEAVPTNTLTKIIPGVAGKFTRFIYIGYDVLDSATGGNILFREGTGTNCGTNTLTFWQSPWDAATVHISGEYGAQARGEIAQTLVAGDDVCFSLAGTITSAFTFGMFNQTPP